MQRGGRKRHASSKLITYQQIAKLQNTYVGVPEHQSRNTRGEEITVAPTGFWKYIDEHGFIHPSFMLHRTVTGRTASADLRSIP